MAPYHRRYGSEGKDKSNKYSRIFCSCTNDKCDGWLWADRMYSLADTRCKKCHSYFEPQYIPSFLAEPYKNRTAKDEKLQQQQQQKPKPQEYDIASLDEEPPEPEEDHELRKRLEKCQGIIHYLEKSGHPQDPALQKEAADIQKKLAQPKADDQEEPSEQFWFKKISKPTKKIA